MIIILSLLLNMLDYLQMEASMRHANLLMDLIEGSERV